MDRTSPRLLLQREVSGAHTPRMIEMLSLSLRQNPLLREAVQEVATSPHVSAHHPPLPLSLSPPPPSLSLSLSLPLSLAISPPSPPAQVPTGQGKMFPENCSLQETHFSSSRTLGPEQPSHQCKLSYWVSILSFPHSPIHSIGTRTAPSWPPKL